MKTVIGFDTETELISESVPIPRLVCLSYAGRGWNDLVKYEHAETVMAALAEEETLLVGHNVSYDAAVLSRHSERLNRIVFGLYDEGRVRCTMIRELLSRIEAGTLKTAGKASLNALAQQHLGLTLDKGEDGWRLRYGELRDVPVEEWPERALSYAKVDATSTLNVYDKQRGRPDEVLQCRADFALRLMAAHGVITDEAEVDRFELGLREKAYALLGDLKDTGLVRADGSRNTKVAREMVEMAFAQRGEQAPRTEPSKRFPGGQTKYNDQTLQESGHPALVMLGKYTHLMKLIDTYVPVMRQGQSSPIHCSYNVLLETGRTSCRRPNWQQLPREPGARECVIARPGKVFVACDYDVAELRALAQVCFSWLGNSELREAFLAGRDPHLELGARLLNMPYEDAVKGKRAGVEAIVEARQFAKIPNFGFPGGLGASSFCSYAKGFGYDISEARSEELKAAWYEQWPEMHQYFRKISFVTSEAGNHKLEQVGSGRIRGDLRFTQAANTMFQGLVADFAKDALWEVTQHCYVKPRSPLYGARPEFFVHDEIILECDEEGAHEVAMELERVMVEVEQRWLPDVPAKAEAHIMRRWSKKAGQVFDKHGRLIPYEDKEK